MSEERIQKMMSSKLYQVVAMTIFVLSFDTYWIMVSGWKFLFPVKLAIAILPFMVFIICRIINTVKENNKKSKKRKDVMFRLYVARIINRDIA